MRYIYIALLLSLSFLTQGQDDGEESNKDRWFSGGGITFGASNQAIAIGLNPILGYRFTDKLSAGGGLTGNYTKFGNNSNFFFGGNIFGRYFITQEIYVQSEFHMTNVEARGVIVGEDVLKTRVWSPQLFIGGGYRSFVSDRVSVNLTVLWDIIEDENSPYINPYIIGGIQFRL